MTEKKMSTIKKRGARSDKNDIVFVALMLILPTLQFLIFYIGTNVNSFALAFQRYEYGEFVFEGWSNFAKVFSSLASDAEVAFSMKNSFVVYIIGLIVSIPLSILFSYYIFKKFALNRTFKVLLFLPSLLSALTLCILYRYFTDLAVPEVIKKMFGVKVDGLFSGAKTEYASLLFAYVFFSFGSTMLLYLGAMSGISESVTEAAEIDGASDWMQLIRIVIPMIFPTIKTFFICGIAGLFSNQFNLLNFYGIGAKPAYETIGYYFYKLTIIGSENYAYVAAFGLLLSAVLIPVTLLINRVLNKVQDKLI